MHDVSIRDQRPKTNNHAVLLFLPCFYSKGFSHFTLFYFAFVLTSVYLAWNDFPFKCVLDEFNLLNNTNWALILALSLNSIWTAIKPANFVLVVYSLDMHLSDGTGMRKGK